MVVFFGDWGEDANRKKTSDVTDDEINRSFDLFMSYL